VFGLPQALSLEQNLTAAAGLLFASSILISFGSGRRSLSAFVGFLASIGLTGLALHAARVRKDRRAFRLVMVLALVDVTQLITRARSASATESLAAAR
jgi:hypothetical protein